MNHTEDRFNPFPGLRPYQTNEDFLFFGREGQSDELLKQLQLTRFVTVVGTSGSGKSSLVRAGLLPALYGGFMTKAGSSWRVASMRPGNDPIGELAKALDQPAVFGIDDGLGESDLTRVTSMTETILRRSALGVVHVVEEAGLPSYENLLLLVDQFEELFRFRDGSASPELSDDAAAFVKLLLEASRSADFEIYVVLTMRSDFLGDCAQFRDLPEAINEGQYLIPRMTRDQYRRTIEGPVAVGGAKITQRLVQRLLSDLGDNPDQLPILQHALMRTWDTWQEQHQNSEPLDLPHYQEIGGMREGLSKHADEVYESLPDEGSREIAEKIFKRLTGKGPDNRGIRWPTQLGELCAVTEASEDEVIAVVDAFRQPGRSFLVPPAGTRIESNTMIDISHESLMRVWSCLRTWVDEESESAEMYRRLAERAVLHKAGRAGLWGDPELTLGLEWREKQKPNKAWAERYHREFDTADEFLDESRDERNRKLAEEEEARKREIRRLQIGLVVALFVIVLVVGAAFYAYTQQQKAETAQSSAEIARDNAETQRRNASDAKREAWIALFEADTAQAKAQAAEREARARLHRAQASDIYASKPLLGIRLALEGLTLLPDEDIMAATHDLIDQGRIANIYSDTVSLAPHPGNSAFYVLGREERLSELWHANSSTQLARLAEPLEDILFNSDGKLFLVNYTSAPSELRRTADGVLTTTLTNDIFYRKIPTIDGRIINIPGVFFGPSTASGIFVVNYEEQPAEIWNSTTDKPLAILVDDVSKVTFSPKETLFEVEYLDLNIPNELHHVSDGSLVVKDFSKVIYNSEETRFIVDYSDDAIPDELRRTSDGSLIETLVDDIFDVTFSPNETLFMVDYLDREVGNELRRAFDGSIVTKLPEGFIESYFSPDDTHFVVDYFSTETSDELRKTSNGSVVTTFDNDISNVIFSPDESLFIADYVDDDVPDELIQTTDGRVVTPLKDDVRNVTFSPEASFIYIEYSDSPGELRRTGDGNLLATDISSIAYSPDETLFLTDYRNPDTPSELRRSADASIFYILVEDAANLTFSPDSTLYYIEHTAAPGELRRTTDGSLLANGIMNVTYSSNGKLLVINYRDPDTPDELMNAVDGSVLASGFRSADFSPQDTFFVVTYEDTAELHRTTDGRLLTVFSNPELSGVNFSSDETAFVVYYADGTAEVFRQAEREPLASFTDQVNNVTFNSQTEQNRVQVLAGQEEHITTLNGQAGESVTINLTANNPQDDNEAYVGLSGPDGFFIDDSGGIQARIDNFELPVSGRYEIRVFGSNPDTYTLSIRTSTTTASDETATAKSPSPTALVAYYTNERAEVWRIPTGKQLAIIDDVASVTFAPNSKNSIFVVEHNSGSFEVRFPTDGNLITLSGPVSNITFSPDEESEAFVVRYTNGTAELRRTIDGELIKRLTSSTTGKEALVLSHPSKTSFLGLRYAGAPTEIYSSTNGEKITDLPGDAYNLLCAVVESVDTCVVAYTETNVPDEVRRASDAGFLTTLTGKVFDVTFSPDPDGKVFIVDYADAPSEIRHVDDGALVAKLPEAVTKVTFSSGPDDSFFIVDFAKIPSQVRRTSDGELLIDQVSKIIFSPNLESKVLIIDHPDAPGEVFDIEAGESTARLAGEVFDTIFSPDKDATTFIVIYADEPAEVRRTADGAPLAQLSGEVLNVDFSLDPEATFFTVQYADKPSEVRRTADGKLLATLNGEKVGLSPEPPAADAPTDPVSVPEADVEFSNSSEALLFVVRYVEGQVEVRRTDDGAVVGAFSEVEDKEDLVSDVIFSQEATAEVFMVQYNSGRHEFGCISECEDISEGELAPPPAGVRNIEWNEGEYPVVLTVSYDEALTQIWRLSDASTLVTSTITNSVERVLVDAETPDIFFVDYNDTTGELYRLTDGELLETLPAEIGKITYYREIPDLFMIEYQESDEPAEMRQTSDGKVVWELSQPVVERVDFSRDKEVFVVYYDNESADLFSTAETKLINSFTNLVGNVVFDNDETRVEGGPLTQSQVEGRITGQSGDTWTFKGQAGVIVTISMEGDFDTQVELFDSKGNLLMENDLFGDIYHAQISNFQLPSTDTYAITARGYGGDTGGYTLFVDGNILFTSVEDEISEPKAATAFVLQFTDGRTEVWPIAGEEALSTFSNASTVTFSPDPDRSIFVVDFSGSLEVYQTADGRRLAREVSDITDIIYSRDPAATYFIAIYEDSPAKIFITSNGNELETLNNNVVDLTFSSDENGTYFVVEYPDDRNEVWGLKDGSARYITDLGSNVAGDFFDVTNERLVIRYENGQVYLIDLEMPIFFRDVSLVDDMLDKACEYLFPPGVVDGNELKNYLGDNEPEACRDNGD